MDSIEQAEKLRLLFTSLWEIMYNNGERNWTNGINIIITSLTPPNYNGLENAKDAIESANQTFGSMLRGNGSFSDYFIWKDDFKERIKANEEFDKIKNDIYNLLP
ncbi:hypothetical protein [Photorhabdus akhurstii]|uniref:hypothetical protein n=1 Tax=Photorhabdus akhurstii TaxID=171438 RepID=UPI000CF99AB9|nr:hypothetical protein C6H64_22985 [Photorhabdus luminescens]PQQ23394.1 hypothetical protein C6H69_24120 [Photorhabdus luminescens]